MVNLFVRLQTYLQPLRLEEWRVRRTDTEQWMHHRQLPPELRERVRKYNLYNWVTTRGVNEEAILKGVPLYLRRDIKRHLCLDLVRRVSFSHFILCSKSENEFQNVLVFLTFFFE